MAKTANRQIEADPTGAGPATQGPGGAQRARPPAGDTARLRHGMLRGLGRQALALAVLGVVALLLRDRIAALDLAAIGAALARVSPLQWALALGATLVSFAALAQYDALIHRALGTGADPVRARRAGWSAIALSQVLGFGLVSGALVRWRMLPGSSLVEASKLTATVAASFLAAWAVLSAGALGLMPATLPGLPPMAVSGLAMLALGLGGALAIAAFLCPELRIGRLVLRLPALPVMGRILWLAAVDTGFAALALWALMPAGSVVPLMALYPAFLLALGAGMVSGTPGGVGAFEVTLILLLPGADQPALLAAVLAWRAVYFGAPAALAVLVVARPRAGACDASTEPGAVLLPAGGPWPSAISWALETAPAETGLLAQGEHGLLVTPDLRAGWMVGRSGQVLAGLLDPFGPTRARAGLIAALAARAEAEGLTPCLYKIGPRSAALARAAGWRLAPVAQEMWLETAGFRLDTPERAGLRRKLRKAAKAGVEVREAHHDAHQPDALPIPALAALNAAWIAARGGERGFSMGRFTPDYIARQRVFIAWQGAVPVGFASFHAGNRDWVLDLMRPGPEAPDGTMQALILAALEAARAAGTPRLSLAALPPETSHLRGPAAAIWQKATRGAGTAGLRQFKMGFAPQGRPLYLAAPSRAALALAAADLARA
ncbi:MAG: DUF2156 domain-containing protein, partial [Sphingomonadales bacterium]|nr:DUF2156 domain-containing protein [Sphingomonadales bacterium]